LRELGLDGRIFSMFCDFMSLLQDPISEDITIQFMKPSDYNKIPLCSVLYFVRSKGLMAE
jgi:hypothetical protein